MKKRALSLTLALILCLGLMPPMPALAAEDYSGVCGKNTTYHFDGDTGTLTISGTGKIEKQTYYGLCEYHWATRLPIYGDYSVMPWYSFNFDPDTGAYRPEFDGRDIITSVVIEEGVTGIGESAFSGLKNLKYVTIPDSVTSIDRWAFYQCRSLTSLTIPNSVTSIDFEVFAECESLTSVNIPDSVTSIDERAFYQCRSLTSLTIPGSVTSISKGAFMYCRNLTNLTISEGVTEIGSDAFHYCESLTSVTIPVTVTRIGNMAFGGCKSLKDIYYQGTRAQWDAIDLYSYRDYVEGEVVHCTDDPDVPDVPDFALSVSSDTVDVFAEEGFQSSGSVTIKNEGLVKIDLVLPTSDYFDISLSQTDLPAGGYATLTIQNKKELKPGTYSETITVRSSDGQASVSVRATVDVDEPFVITPVDFTDVPKTSIYYMPISWAVGKGITSGTSETTFSPDAICTRGQVAAFLWRAAGQPEPKTASSPFTDVQDPSAYYYKPILWAVENGITSGTSETTFSPNVTCARSHILTFLWRAAGQPEPESASSPFNDVQNPSAFYYKAALWTAENGILQGDTFSPDAPCSRALTVFFLYRRYQ